MQDCIFCKIGKHEIPTNVEFENDSVISFPSNDPVAEFHFIIIPKKHIISVLDIEDNDKDIFMEMVKAAEHLIKEKNISDGYKLIFNGGKYQSIKHLHWHLLAGKLEEGSKPENRT
ncbi:histidine triad nucleotide-binding protein [soil metagenome]